MPDESTNPVGTTQTSQDNQTGTNQSGNDFVLDFGDLGDNNAPASKEVQVDSLSTDEEKTGDELGFDIDLGSDNENLEEKVEDVSMGDNSSVESDVSANSPEEEPVNDFNISMDYTGTTEEEIAQENNEIVEDNEEIVPDEEIVEDNEEVVPDEEIVEDNEEAVPDEEIVEDNEEIVPDEEIVEDNEEIVPDEEIVEDNEEIVPDEEPLDEELSLSFTKDESNGNENLDITNQPSEGHLFHQINEDNQSEISFDSNNSDDSNEDFSSDESISGKPLFMGADNTPTNESLEENGEITFDLPKVSDNAEGLLEDMEAPEQKQPELGDLLSNSPIDLSKELNDVSENPESDLFDTETPVEEVKTGYDVNLGEVVSEQAPEEAVGDIVTNEISSETTLQEVKPEQNINAENNEFLLDAPQTQLEPQNLEEAPKSEIVENNVELQSQEQSQTDEINKIADKVVSEANESNAVTSEINITTPVELSNVSSSQIESTFTGTEGQVQSTLSLDQILDSELLSNPQYADNSKASPQNMPASGGKSKMGLLVGIGVAALACCVAVLAFPSIIPSININRSSDDVTTTGTVAKYPITDDSHSSAPEEPIGLQDSSGDPTGVEDPQIADTSDFTGIPSVGGGQVVNFPDDGDDSGNDDGNADPVPYVWTDDGQNNEPTTEEPVVEDVDKNHVLDVISSFKIQAETYYSLSEQNTDKQLMKYSLRLISVCDNYKEKVSNGEGLDSESLSIFKSNANKIISKIDTYLGGDDEDVQVIREATIDGESYFPGKDELKEYIYNNR